MALPDKQELLDEVDGLGSIPDSTLESIATAGLIEFLQGSPLDPSLPRQALITSADRLQCLKRQDVLGLFVRKLLDVLYEIASGVGATEVTEFPDVPTMLASDTNLWTQAFASNYFGLDGIKTQWMRTLDLSTLPNGSDILQATDGAILIRTFLRENDGSGITFPNPIGTPYIVAVPISYPTLGDMRNGTEVTNTVFLMSDANGDAGMFELGGLGTNDGVNEVTNAAGVSYQRVVLT